MPTHRQLERRKFLGVVLGSMLVVHGCGTPSRSLEGGDVGTPAKPETTIAVLSIVEIEPIAELRRGFRAELEGSEYAKTHSIRWTEYNAQGDMALVTQISDQVTQAKPHVAYVLGTPFAQALQARSETILLVQGGVTDPVEAGLATDWSGSGRRYIATSDLPPVDIQLDFIRSAFPSARILGVVYNPSEANSVAVVKRLRAASQPRGFELSERAISTTAEIASIADSLGSGVDAVYIPPDNTVHAGLASLGASLASANVPMFASTPDALQHGALASLSLDYEVLGRQSAKLLLSVLADGANPSKLPIETLQNPQMIISPDRARAFQLDLASLEARFGTFTVWEQDNK